MLVPRRNHFFSIVLQWQGSALAQVGPLLAGVALVAFLLPLVNGQWSLEAIDLTPTPFTLLGLPLSIFLGFRNNACYDRWWEARKLWGGLVNTTRTVARQARHVLRGDGPEVIALRREITMLLVAYAHALRLHLRLQSRWEDLDPFLDDADLATVKAARNRPQAVLDLLSLRLRRALDMGALDPLHLPHLDQGLVGLTDIQGACERIKNTPVPVTYSELTHHIVGLYVLFLPFGLFHTLGAVTPIVTVTVAYCFLGLDAVGTQIENPFEEDPNDLPLAQLSRLIENDLRSTLGDVDLRPDLKPRRGILL